MPTYYNGRILSAHLLPVDSKENFLLEWNPHFSEKWNTRVLSLIGGKREVGEKPLPAAMREGAEEMKVGNLFFHRRGEQDFSFVDREDATIDEVKYYSDLFAFRIPDLTASLVSRGYNMWYGNYDDLRSTQATFLVEREQFLSRIQKSLKIISDSGN